MTVYLRGTRYADFYTRMYRVRCTRHGGLARALTNELWQFRQAPARLNSVPGHVETLVRTQAIAERANVPDALIGWCLRLSEFVRRRAARVLTHRFLLFLYRPDGAWFQRTSRRYVEEGFCFSPAPGVT